MFFRKILVFFMLFFYNVCAAHDYYDISICAIFQDESPYLKEWIDYHIKVGVKHFWLYNNNSQDDYKNVLKPYIDHNIVELIEWPSYKNENDFTHFSFVVQTSAYNDAINKARYKSKWLAIIDTDEFIVPVCNSTIIEVLENYYWNASGLCVNWQCYGTSHVSRCNPGEMLENLTWKSKWDHPRNLYYKSIVQPLHVQTCSNPHYCFYLPNHWHINTNYEAIGQENTAVYIDKIRINHYWTRDEWFLHNTKIPRYAFWGINAEHILEASDEMNEEYDPIILNRLRN